MEQHIAARPVGPATRRAVLPIWAGGAGALAACASPSPGGGQTGAGAVDLRGVTIEYLQINQATHPQEHAQTRVFEDFSKHDPHGLTITTLTGAESIPKSNEKVLGLLAAGTPPDLINNFHTSNALLFTKGALVDLDAELKQSADWKRARADAYPNILSGVTWQGKVFAVPTSNSLYLMYYHPGLLDRVSLAAPPKDWTWDRFVEYGKKAARPPEVTLYDDNWTYSRTGMMLLNNGARFSSADGRKFVIDSPEVAETLEWQVGLIKQGLMREHDGTATGGYSEKVPQGTVLFQLGVPNRIATWRQQRVEFGTCHYPLGLKNREKRNATHGVPFGMAVLKHQDPRRTRAALAAALWSARPESGLTYFEVGGSPPSYRSSVESTEFKTRWQKDKDYWPFFEVLAGFSPYPNFPALDDVQTVVNQQLAAIWAGKVSVRDGLREAQRLADLEMGKPR